MWHLHRNGCTERAGWALKHKCELQSHVVAPQRHGHEIIELKAFRPHWGSQVPKLHLIIQDVGLVEEAVPLDAIPRHIAQLPLEI